MEEDQPLWRQLVLRGELIKFEAELSIHSLMPFWDIGGKRGLAVGRGESEEFSKHRPSGPMLSISRFVRPSVCMSVRLSVCSLLRYRLTVFLPPLPKAGCPIFLEIRNPWEK